MQWLSAKAQWEPALIQVLAPMADDCLALQRRELTEGQDLPTALPASLAQGWARVVSTRGRAAQALLLSLVREVAAETGRILTLDGLAGEVPSLHAHGHDSRAAYEALAGGPALEEYVKKGFVEFGQVVAGRLKQARAEGLSPDQACQLIEPLAAGWRARLTTLARTISHEVFNRARQAVCQGLR